MQREQLLNNRMENAFFKVPHELLHQSQRPFQEVPKNKVLMGQMPQQQKKFHILMLGHLVHLLVW